MAYICVVYASPHADAGAAGDKLLFVADSYVRPLGSGRIGRRFKSCEMIEQATVDAYGESEQITGWLTVIDGNLAVLFQTLILGVQVTVERVDLDCNEQIVAVCRRGRARQSLSILDLPLPKPPPDGAEWVEAYRRWRAAGHGAPMGDAS